MKTIKIFLASSNELKAEREKFENEISRKTIFGKIKSIVRIVNFQKIKIVKIKK